MVGSSMKKLLIIDGDAIAYRVAAGVESSGTPPEEGCNYVDEIYSNIGDKYAASDGVTFLSGLGNFRYDVPVPCVDKSGPQSYTELVYKANRKGTPPPACLPRIRNHIREAYDALFVNGAEADDAVSLCADFLRRNGHAKSFVIVGNDKDLDQIPGLHFNWVRGTEYDLTPEEVNQFWRIQMLMGDRTDNIPGLPGIGVSKAAKLQGTLESIYQEYYGDKWQLALGNQEKLISLLNFAHPVPKWLGEVKYGQFRQVMEKAFNQLTIGLASLLTPITTTDSSTVLPTD